MSLVAHLHWSACLDKSKVLEWLRKQKQQAHYSAEREVKYGGNKQYVDEKIAEVSLITDIIEMVEEGA